MSAGSQGSVSPQIEFRVFMALILTHIPLFFYITVLNLLSFLFIRAAMQGCSSSLLRQQGQPLNVVSPGNQPQPQWASRWRCVRSIVSRQDSLNSLCAQSSLRELDHQTMEAQPRSSTNRVLVVGGGPAGAMGNELSKYQSVWPRGDATTKSARSGAKGVG